MIVLKLIAELREERACIEQVILSLERLALLRGPRRGRPPSWFKVANDSPPKKMAQAAI
jgi:hypothetical protein